MLPMRHFRIILLTKKRSSNEKLQKRMIRMKSWFTISEKTRLTPFGVSGSKEWTFQKKPGAHIRAMNSLHMFLGLSEKIRTVRSKAGTDWNVPMKKYSLAHQLLVEVIFLPDFL